MSRLRVDKRFRPTQFDWAPWKAKLEQAAESEDFDHVLDTVMPSIWAYEPDPRMTETYTEALAKHQGVDWQSLTRVQQTAETSVVGEALHGWYSDLTTNAYEYILKLPFLNARAFKMAPLVSPDGLNAWHLWRLGLALGQNPLLPILLLTIPAEESANVHKRLAGLLPPRRGIWLDVNEVPYKTTQALFNVDITAPLRTWVEQQQPPEVFRTLIPERELTAGFLPNYARSAQEASGVLILEMTSYWLTWTDLWRQAAQAEGLVLPGNAILEQFATLFDVSLENP